VGRPAGNGTQAERVLRIHLALSNPAHPVWFKELGRDLGVGERTIRRDLAVIDRVIAPERTVEHAEDGQVRLVARAVTALDAVHHAARRGEP
jgi:predicted DNA-binding transcriptional regulator YafY